MTVVRGTYLVARAVAPGLVGPMRRAPRGGNCSRERAELGGDGPIVALSAPLARLPGPAVSAAFDVETEAAHAAFQLSLR